MATKAEIEMLWVNAWSDLYEIIKERNDVRCLLPDGEVTDVEECKHWLQDSAYSGYVPTVKVGWVLGRSGVIASRTRPPVLRSTSAAFQRWFEQYECSGELGCVRLGVTRDEVRSWFGEPDDTARGFRRKPLMGIWRYGIVEFHFGYKGELYLVYSEQPDLVPRTILSEPSK